MEKLLFVEGFPATMTDHELSSLFASVGRVSSARVVKDHMGESLRFGYVDMASEAEAVAAKQAFHRTHIEGELLIVDFARFKWS